MAISTVAQGLSYVQYEADGVIANFPLIFLYQDPLDVYVYVDGIEVTYTYLNAAEVTPTVLPTLGQTVTLRRFTQSDERKVNFEDGGQLSESLLDLNSDQLFFLTQEAKDVADLGVQIDPLTQTIDFKGNRGVNGSAAVDPTDYIILSQIDDLITAVNTAGVDATNAAVDATASLVAANLAAASAAAVEGIAQAAEDTADALTVTVNNFIAGVGTDIDDAIAAQAVLTTSEIGVAVATIVDSAPATLNTLDELAASLGDDPNFATTIATALGNRVRVDTDAQGLTGPEKTNAKTNIDLQNVDNTSDATKNAATASLTNKALISPTRLDPKKDTKANLVTYATTAQNGELVYATDDKKQFQVKDGVLVALGAGGQGGITYITNYNLEDDAIGFNTYADAADSSPVDGTGGAPGVTVARDISNPLRGVASLLFTKPASNVQGQGFSYDFTVDASDKGKVIQGGFEYQITSGTFADNDVSVWIYDVTNARLIQPAPYLLKNSGIIEKYGYEFQTSIDSVSYRLILHVSSVSALAYTVKMDNFFVGPAAKLYGSAVTDWIAYTPTLNSNTSVASNTAYHRRVGDSIEIQGLVTYNGVGAATPLTISLPTGLTLNTSKLSSGSSSSVGTGYWSDAGTAFKNIMARANTSSFAFYDHGGAGTLGSNAFANGDVVSYSVLIPVQGWSSSQIQSSDADTRVVSFVGNVATNQSLTANVTELPLTTIKDSHGAWTGANYVVKVAGDYNVSAWVYSTSLTAGVTIHLNGTRINTFISTSVAGGGGSALLPNLKAGDIISIRADTTITLAGNASSKVSIHKLSGPAQIMASESVSASFWASANFAATASIPINFDSKEHDSHNAVTTSPTAWRFTAPKAAEYTIGGMLYGNATATRIFIYKNGTIYKQIGWTQGGVMATPSTSIKLLAGDYIDFRPTTSVTFVGGTLSGNDTAQISISSTGNY